MSRRVMVFSGIICVIIQIQFISEDLTWSTSPLERAVSSLEEIPSALKENSTCEVNVNLSNFICSLDLGWDDPMGAPEWLSSMCPEVVDHFTRFPSFQKHLRYGNSWVPIQTTQYIAHAVCTMKVVNAIAASINARVYLHAGSHLGAVIHGQPIVWDDDVDMWMDFSKMESFLEVCRRFGDQVPILKYPSRVELHCVTEFNAVKVWLQPEGAEKLTPPWAKHWSPFVDVFMFKVRGGNIDEVSPEGSQQRNSNISFRLRDFFPSRPFYFGGIHLMGPPASLAKARYTLQNCKMGVWNHRLEQFLADRHMNLCIDCRQLYKLFPFVYNTSMKVTSSMAEQALFPDVATVFQPLLNTTLNQRRQLFQSHPSEAQQLTDQIPHLDEVEIDNTISPSSKCMGNKIKVIEFNAERGKRWYESAEVLKEFDVIILNEMDVGMARSDQQHTTRLLAYYLGMNYAWGVEFIELTLGDLGDRTNIDQSEENFHGLHGNAILSRCHLRDARIFRNPVGDYFSDKPNNVNAHGLEKRLGGRMILLTRILIEGTSVVIGSTHKSHGFHKEIRDYVGHSPAVIAGDQDALFCGNVGLKNILSDPHHHTWPASCTGFGNHRGDNICANMDVSEKEFTVKPCVDSHGLNISLGDHALTGASFKLP